MVLTDDAQAIETKHLGFTISARTRSARSRRPSARRGARRRGRSCSRSARRRRRSSSATAWRSAPTAAILLETDGEEWDAQATAAAIVDAVARRRTGFDLILFGNESADAGGYQVGIRVAHALGLPVVTGLKKIEVVGETCEVRA